MGAAQKIEIHGEKGGSSKPKSPSEASDSLRSTNLAKLLIAVGEGEFDEVPTDYSIFLDNTPIRDASGNYNFPNVKWDWRSGSVDQTYIPGIPAVENETSLNVELRSDSPWVRSITNTQLSAVRMRFAWPALQRQDDEGNVGGYRIDFAIDLATDGGAYQQVFPGAVDGKTTTRYERSIRVDLPEATSGWQIRVRRLTPNQNSNKIADTMLIAGYTEVIDAKLRYPNTALLYIEFDAEQFTNIPAVTVKCRARRWQVPSNYDPIARTYTGTWDGTMKQAWTNNPAWITYGICTEDRFGLGKRIKSFMVDKWELYRIAQYADQLVPNGLGGVEPRFLCDMNLQGKADAWSLLRDIAGIYRGMTYWAQGQLVMQADMPRAQDFDYVFTRANVIDGKFSYGSASAKTRYTRALVSYDNPANNYDTDVIPFADLELQRRMGDKPTELSAIGCTRASEAQRRGKWAILSNNQDRTISFKTGMEGVIPLPGHIIPVADSLLAGREVGGRISAVAGRVVTLDRDTQAKAGDRLIINLPGGRAEGRTVQSVNGRAVTVTTNYSEPPLPQLQWALDADDLAIPLYRVLRTKRTTEGDFEISALQYDPSKFAYIDTGARLEERPISVIPITVVPAPASVTVTSNSVVSQGIAVATMTITWPAVNGAVGYDVEWRKDSGNWIKLQRTGMTSVDVVGIYAGAYVARVRAVSAFDISSIWRNSILTNLKGKEGLPPAVSFLTATPLLFGIYLKWGFPPGAEDTQRTEIWCGPSTSLEAATKLTDLSYPQSDFSMLGLKAGVTLFFWARLVDRTGNIGPFYPVGLGVMGQTSADASPILDQIAGEIGETELGQDLLGRIELIDGPSTLLGSVNNRLKELDDQVAEVTDQLQEQIDQVSDIANSAEYQKDKAYAAGASTRLNDRLYQAKVAVPVDLTGAVAPPNTTYWLDVGQIVTDSNGLAARVSTTETKITSIEGVNTAQGTAITGLQSSLDGKADASALNSLTTRVSSAEGTISSQGTAITGLNNSLTTTNTNVTVAQNAANAANTLAGGKGKVLVQTAAPAAADQLVQNLWIDITGGANTPKRWTGSAWAAVTDKVATDAAAAAASALTQVATKAEAATVQALSNTVTQQGDTITAQGQSLTSIQTSIGGLGAAGTNLLVDKYSWLTSATLPATVSGSSLARAGVSVAEASSGFGIKLTTASTSTSQFLMLSPTNNLAGWNIDLEPGSYLVSMYVQASAVGAMRISMYNGSHRYSANATYGTTRQRMVFVCTATAFARAAITIYPNMSALAAGTEITIDSIMIEKMAGANTSAMPSPFVAGNSAVSVSGQAVATSALDARVTQTEGVITAQASAFQALRASSRDDNGEGELADALKGWTSTAAIASESKVRTSENEAMAQRITTFDAAIGENAANITELEQVVATNESATATQIGQLNVSVGQNTAAIQQTSTAYADTSGKLNTMWSVKMQVTAGGQYVAAGIGLGIENTGAGLQSQFLVSADRFAIVNSIAGGAISVPFAVQGGQVFMNSAFIADGTITNAKIGSYISSTNYIAGQQGWILNKDGTLEINGIVPGQGRLVINSLHVSVYDANNVLRVRLGYLG
jgi:predicted phage tail protein